MTSAKTKPATGPRKRRFTLRTAIWLLVLLVAVFEVGASLVFYFEQDELLFVPHSMTRQDAADIRADNPGLREIMLTATDGTHLQGWTMEGQAGRTDRLILFIGGQGAEVSGSVVETATRTGWTTVGFNYRGIGLSGGEPSESALEADILTVYDSLTQRAARPRHLVLMGHSLGTGVAVYLAQQRDADGIILISPYDSVSRVAQERIPFLPVSLLIKHRFDSFARAPSISIPLLALAAAQDKTIPPLHSLRLVARWGGQATLTMIPGADNDTVDGDIYWNAVKQYLATFK